MPLHGKQSVTLQYSSYLYYITVLLYSYANLSLLFARYHAKIIPWGHKTADFVALGFQDSDEDEDEDDHEE